MSIPGKESNAIGTHHVPPFSQGQQSERSLDSHPMRTRLDRAATG